MSQTEPEQVGRVSGVPAKYKDGVKADNTTSHGHSAAEVKADDTYHIHQLLAIREDR